MAVRKIVSIDEELCDGCGLCVPSCAEGAIRIIDGKARLVGDNLCDGLGACLGECPQGAITVTEREAAEFDEEAVRLARAAGDAAGGHRDEPIGAGVKPQAASTHGVADGHHHGGGCPGSRLHSFARTGTPAVGDVAGQVPSRLGQWPVQLHLLPPTAPFLRDSDLVLAADCAAFAFGDFHNRFIRGRSLAIACPKLDSGLDEYLQKLTGMIDHGGINTLTVVIMEVPCCGGLLHLAMRAVQAAERKIPLKMVKISLKGDILDERWVQV
ncbi:MAG TPA: 4Fe-4S binding protein [Myxococcota bacterium]|nr:4Fe-4S binding protein [Myxococcota bacterium]HOA13410.1 4Fe-4S binding protein [Myxococcota bacterium]HOH76635.1 4Fe-4S binding protein [Myxococcota bacterium]HPV03666.1 4Fe-4S binding protein [Myxococcota bacterium]